MKKFNNKEVKSWRYELVMDGMFIDVPSWFNYRGLGVRLCGIDELMGYVIEYCDKEEISKGEIMVSGFDVWGDIVKSEVIFIYKRKRFMELDEMMKEFYKEGGR